jgi:hypothetical protein
MDQAIELTHGMTNVFALEKPEQYLCRLSVGSNDLTTFGSIWLRGAEDDLYIALTDIRYLQGSIIWRGANFETASQVECYQLLTQIGLEIPEKFSPRYYLLKAETPDGSIRILTLRAFLTSDLEQYHQTQDAHVLQRITIRPRDGEPYILKYREYSGQNYPYASSTVAEILQKFEDGFTHSQVLAWMPWLEPEDIQACFVYARRAVKKHHEQD